MSAYRIMYVHENVLSYSYTNASYSDILFNHSFLLFSLVFSLSPSTQQSCELIITCICIVHSCVQSDVYHDVQ